MANGTRHQQKLQEFVEEFNCWYKWVLFADIKKNNVLNINQTLGNSKYALLFPFSIYIHTEKVKQHHIFFRRHYFGSCRTEWKLNILNFIVNFITFMSTSS